MAIPSHDEATCEAGGSEALRAFLARHGVPGELVRPGAEMPTVARAAAALGVAPAQIVKSVVFQHKKDARRVCVAIVAGDARVHPGKVARALDLSQLKLASAGAALEATGYAVGGIPPLGYPLALPVVVDQRVLAHAVVFGGGGDEHHMLRIAPADIVRATSAVAADVVVDAVEADEVPA